MSRSQRLSAVLRVLLPLLVLALVGAVVPAAQATDGPATSTATVTGVVTADGAPLAGAHVSALLPDGVYGSSPSTTTDATGHYQVKATVYASGTTPLKLDIVDSTPGSHHVSQEVTITITPDETVTHDAALSSFDARVIATVNNLPAGVDPLTEVLWVEQSGSSLVRYGEGGSGVIEVDGIGRGDHEVNFAYGTDADGNNGSLYYPGTTDYQQEKLLSLQAGCTTSLSIDVGAGTMTTTRDCSRLPECQSANTALATATHALASKTKAATKAKKKYKKAKKHHAGHAKLKKLKKKVKKARAVQHTYAVARASAAATEQRTCH